MTLKTSLLGELNIDTVIAASSGQVWEALTSGIGSWWPAEFYSIDPGSNPKMALEAHPGGRMFESADGGAGTLWGTVISVDPQRLLQIVGYQFPNWGGPSQWYGTWNLGAQDDRTLLQFSEAVVGRISAETLESKRHGWAFLWSTMKASIEGLPAPE